MRIVTNKEGKSRGYAFIEYEDQRQAEIAYQRGEGKKIDDFRVKVDRELGRVDRYWLPRRLGGGKGGDKRKASREHDDYIKGIKRELRKEQEAKVEAEKKREQKLAAHSETLEVENTKDSSNKRQKTAENENPEGPPQRMPSNKGYIAKALVQNLQADPPKKQRLPEKPEDKEMVSANAADDLEEGEL